MCFVALLGGRPLVCFPLLLCYGIVSVYVIQFHAEVATDFGFWYAKYAKYAIKRIDDKFGSMQYALV